MEIIKSGNRFIIGLDHGNHLIKTAHHIMQNGVKRLGAKPTFMANTLNYGRTYYKVGEERINVKDSNVLKYGRGLIEKKRMNRSRKEHFKNAQQRMCGLLLKSPDIFDNADRCGSEI